MNYWYFRVDHPFPAGSEKMDGFDHSLELIQRRRFAGGKGDQAVILTSLDKLSFVAIGVVNNVEEGKLDEMGYRSIKVSMRLQWNHNELNLLDDFAYSLTRVRDFNRPERSFTRIYGRLEGVEVKAIKSGEIFIRRTVFGHLVNALHIDHRQSFIEWFISNNYKAAYVKPDIVEASEALIRYVEYAILEPNRILKRSYDYLKDIVPDEADNIGFSDSPEGVVDLIASHYTISNDSQDRDLTKVMKSVEYLNSLSVDYDIQHEFGKLFLGRQLPILL